MFHGKFVVVVGLAAGALLGCEGQAKGTAQQVGLPPAGNAPSGASDQVAPNANVLTLVTDASQVCMVNNQFMGTAQIPVEVEGRTYYGCCEMCKSRLAKDPSVRTATDPVSGKHVDKASAVIARAKDGRTLYFEGLDTFAQYGLGPAH